MTIHSNRSMNMDLAIGAVEGKVRFLRPDAGGPSDESHAQQRSGELHSQHYGTFGISQGASGVIQANVPTATPPFVGGY